MKSLELLIAKLLLLAHNFHILSLGLFDQPVTFRKFDSIIFFDTFWTRDSWELNTWDISFRFKTTAENGVMVYRSGANDFIEIKLVSKSLSVKSSLYMYR